MKINSMFKINAYPNRPFSSEAKAYLLCFIYKCIMNEYIPNFQSINNCSRKNQPSTCQIAEVGICSGQYETVKVLKLNEYKYMYT